MYSFLDWCNDNDRHDLINLWDEKLNCQFISDVSYKSNKKYYFKCPNGIHESKLQNIQYFSSGKQSKLICDKCLSIGQYIIDHPDLKAIWSDDNELDKWKIRYKSNKKAIFVCKNNSSHIYKQTIQHFSEGCGCKFCSHQEINKEESLGMIFPFVKDIWSEKNDKSCYDYYQNSGISVWWKCQNGIHPDYKRKISSSNTHGFRCPKCSHIDAGNKNSIDLTGMEFGKLKVIKYGYSKNNRRYWLCQCSCGSEPKYISVGHLISGSIISCGCYHIESISGENNRNWKGGITAENLSARSSSEYERWRKAVYKKDNFTCQCCGKKCNKLNAHHIYSFSDHKEIRYDLTNGITMCEKCHYSSIIGSFHNIYGTQNNTPEQLIEYINKIRKINNIDIIFSLDDYLSGKNILS